jgi:hypothetical protein
MDIRAPKNERRLQSCGEASIRISASLEKMQRRPPEENAAGTDREGP